MKSELLIKSKMLKKKTFFEYLFVLSIKCYINSRVGLFFIIALVYLLLYMTINSYGHVGMVNSTNHTYFLGKLEQAVNQYFVHKLSLVTEIGAYFLEFRSKIGPPLHDRFK